MFYEYVIQNEIKKVKKSFLYIIVFLYIFLAMAGVTYAVDCDLELLSKHKTTCGYKYCDCKDGKYNVFEIAVYAQELYTVSGYELIFDILKDDSPDSLLDDSPLELLYVIPGNEDYKNIMDKELLNEEQLPITYTFYNNDDGNKRLKVSLFCGDNGSCFAENNAKLIRGYLAILGFKEKEEVYANIVLEKAVVYNKIGLKSESHQNEYCVKTEKIDDDGYEYEICVESYFMYVDYINYRSYGQLEPDSDLPEVSIINPKLTIEAESPMTEIDYPELTFSYDKDSDYKESFIGPYTNIIRYLKLGSYDINWFGYDQYGNMIDFPQQVTIQDTTPPEFRYIPADIFLYSEESSVLVDIEQPPDAEDLVDVDCPVYTNIDINKPFDYGTHKITWIAKDNSGNQATKDQTVTIKKSQEGRSVASFVGEKKTITLDEIDDSYGQKVTILIKLDKTDEDKNKVVKIKYGFNQTNISSDSTNLASQDDELEFYNNYANITFYVYNNILIDEEFPGYINFEIYTVEDEKIYAVPGRNKTFSLVIKENKTNSMPDVSISLEQGGEPIKKVSYTGKPITVKALVTDSDSEDRFTYEWTCEGEEQLNCLLPEDTNSEDWTIYKADLVSGNSYILKVKVTDDNSVGGENGTLSNTARTFFYVSEKNTNSVFKDSDEDGIQDDLEPDGEEETANILYNKSKASVTAADDLTLVIGSLAISGENDSPIVTSDQIDSPPDDFKLTEDIFDFELKGLSNAGDSAKIVLNLSEPLQENSVYLKYSDIGYSDGYDSKWRTFKPYGRNDIRSAFYESSGRCPAPGDEAFKSGLLTGANCVELTIQDGGIYDADGVKNLQISDPGGIAVPSSSDDDSSGCFIATAAYGNYIDENVRILTAFRDKFLLTNRAGKAFVDIYYKYSPPIAGWIKKHPSGQKAVRFALTPLIYLIKYPFILLLCIYSSIFVLALLLIKRKVQKDYYG